MKTKRIRLLYLLFFILFFIPFLWLLKICIRKDMPVKPSEVPSTTHFLNSMNPKMGLQNGLFFDSSTPVAKVTKDSKQIKIGSKPTRISSKKTKVSSKKTRISSKPIKISPEPAKIDSEPTKISSEPIQVNPEPIKPSSEPAKISSEQTKISSEPTQISPKPTKISPEPVKISPEPAKISFESTDISSQQTAIGSEPAKISSEQTDIGFKQTKASSEVTPVVAEENSLRSKDVEKSSPSSPAIDFSNRRGFFLGFGPSLGYVANDIKRPMGGVQFRIGAGLTDQTLLFIENNFTFTNKYNFNYLAYDLQGKVQHFFYKGFYANAGAGYSIGNVGNSAVSPVTKMTKAGFGASGGLGYEIRLEKKFAFSPEVAFYYRRLGEFDYFIPLVNLYMNWYF